MRINISTLSRQIKLEQTRQDNRRDVQGDGSYQFQLPTTEPERTEAIELLSRLTAVLDSLPPIPRVGRAQRYARPVSTPETWPFEDDINAMVADVFRDPVQSAKPTESNWPFEDRN